MMDPSACLCCPLSSEQTSNHWPGLGLARLGLGLGLGLAVPGLGLARLGLGLARPV